jgi:hypothetical protein
MKNKKHNKEQRHMMQLIRRNMITKVKKSKKTYDRKNTKNQTND